MLKKSKIIFLKPVKIFEKITFGYNSFEFFKIVKNNLFVLCTIAHIFQA